MNMRNTCLHACLELFEVMNKDMKNYAEYLSKSRKAVVFKVS